MKTKTKTKNLSGSLKELDGLENDSSSNDGNGWMLAILALLGLGGATWFFMNNKSSVDIEGLIEYRNRDVSQIKASALAVQKLYSLHGVDLKGKELKAAVQEFFDLEKNLNSNVALKQIETKLAATSGKTLVYGQSTGLYGLAIRG